MSRKGSWSFPEELQPASGGVSFDIDRALDAMVLLRSEVPEDAFTAPILGTERAGYGVVIRDDGLLLTIGYLVTEAATVWLTTNRGAVLAGHPLAYDQATGFGLVQPLGQLELPALPLGSIRDCANGDEVIVAGHGGRGHALRAKIVAKREFAGYWEYALDEAIFTAPAHPQWGGTALLDRHGHLLGIGSLLVQEQVDDDVVQGNMFVPIDLLRPILDDLLKFGRVAGPARPWLGIYVTDTEGVPIVAGLADGGPAKLGQVKIGDQVLDVAGERVTGLADFYRKVWRLGPAGAPVPLTLSREGLVVQVQLRSADRQDFLKKPELH